jgi:hypothetical protein
VNRIGQSSETIVHPIITAHNFPSLIKLSEVSPTRREINVQMDIKRYVRERVITEREQTLTS